MEVRCKSRASIEELPAALGEGGTEVNESREEIKWQ